LSPAFVALFLTSDGSITTNWIVAFAQASTTMIEKSPWMFQEQTLTRWHRRFHERRDRLRSLYPNKEGKGLRDQL
jgi:hypothetical protein